MLFRKQFPLWIWVSLFAVSIAAMPLTYRMLRRPVGPLRTLTELTALLSQDTPSLYVVPMSERDLEFGIYICTSPQSRGQLMQNLPRNPKFGSRWQGIVYCERIGEKSMCSLEEELPSWGEYGMRIGRFYFFGDPDLLQRIHTAMDTFSGGAISCDGSGQVGALPAEVLASCPTACCNECSPSQRGPRQRGFRDKAASQRRAEQAWQLGRAGAAQSVGRQALVGDAPPYSTVARSEPRLDRRAFAQNKPS